jgi:hypothetical protein
MSSKIVARVLGANLKLLLHLQKNYTSYSTTTQQQTTKQQNNSKQQQILVQQQQHQQWLAVIMLQTIFILVFFPLEDEELEEAEDGDEWPAYLM